MTVKELIKLLEKFPPDCEVIYDGANQLINDNHSIEYADEGTSLTVDFDGSIEDFYLQNVEDLVDKTYSPLLCLTAKLKKKGS